MAQFASIEDLREYVSVDFKRMIEYSAKRMDFTPPWHHFAIADWMQGGYPPRSDWISRAKVLMGFRLAAKTYILREYNKWRWLRWPQTQIVIHSSTDPVAKRLTKAQRKSLQDDPLTAHLAPGDTGGAYEFNLAGVEPEQGYSLFCAGIKTSVTSSRADLYEFDDPEPDDDPESMHDRIILALMEAKHILHRPDRHVRAAGRTVVPVPERTQLVVVGQPHTPNTCYFPETSEVDEHEGHPLGNAKYLIVPAVNKNTDYWIWPEMMESKHFDYDEGRPMTIEEARKEYTTLNWECQMAINPLFAQSKGQVLKIAEIEECLRVVENPFIAIDPADSSEDGCEWGVVIGGVFHGPKGFQIHINWMGGFTGEAYEGEWADGSIGESVWRQIFDMAFEFNVHNVLLEKNYKAARSACARFLRKTGISMNVEEVPATRNKLWRICNALEQPVNNGMITAHPAVLADRANTKQFSRIRWNKLPKPVDRLDALALMVDWFTETAHELKSPDSPEEFAGMFQNVCALHTFDRLGVPGRSLAS